MENKIPNPILNLFRLTWKYSKGRRHILVAVLTLFIIANSISLITPYLIGKIFNLIQSSEQSPELF